MPLCPRDNLKEAKYFPPPKSRSMSKQRTSFLCLSNFFTQSLLFTGLQLDLKAVKVTVKYIMAGLTKKSAVDPHGIVACFPMFSELVMEDKSAKEWNISPWYDTKIITRVHFLLFTSLSQKHLYLQVQ